MVTPRTGHPRGQPKKNWLQDPDRHVIALADALKVDFAQPFERALLLAWSILHGEPIQAPANLLRHAHRLMLSNPTRRRLEAGWVRVSWNAPKIKREQAVGRLKKKTKRFADDRPRAAGGITSAPPGWYC